MTSSRVTPWSLLATDGDALAENLAAEAVLDGTREVVGAVGDAVWTALYGELVEVLRRICEVDLVEPLVRGWCSYRDLRRAGAETLGTDRAALVDLDQRKVTLTKQPRVEMVVVNGPVEAVVAVLTFELRVEVTAHTLVAVVRNGRLVELTGGALDLAVSLHAGAREIAAAHRSREARLVVPLGDGILLATVPRQRETPDPTGGGDRPGAAPRIDSTRS
jgi:hypothetical protein